MSSSANVRSISVGTVLHLLCFTSQIETNESGSCSSPGFSHLLFYSILVILNPHVCFSSFDTVLAATLLLAHAHQLFGESEFHHHADEQRVAL